MATPRKRTPAKKPGTKVTKPKKNDAAVIGGMSRGEMATAYAGAGSKEVGQAEMALPFLNILQALSPQVAKKDDAYVEGAEPGMFHESVSGAIWDGDEGVMIIPCHFSRHIIEWIKRKEGGGFVGLHPPDMREAEANCKDLDKHDLVDTHQQAVLVRLPDGTWSEAIFPLKMTGLTPSRLWNTDIGRQRREIDGVVHTDLPRWWSVWKATTVEKANDKGRFFVLKKPECQVDLFDMEEAAQLVPRAKGFEELMDAGAGQVDWRRMDGEEIPEAEVEDGAPGF